MNWFQRVKKHWPPNSARGRVTPVRRGRLGLEAFEERVVLAQVVTFGFGGGLLQVRVPLQVTLASQRTSVQEIIELGPGSILAFDKTCEEPMDLMVGNRTLAQGEVVKVGDKFGLRIRNIVRK